MEWTTRLIILTTLAITNVCYRETFAMKHRKHATESAHTQVPLEHRNPSQLHLAEYDFIIVGAGSAGSVIANRLSEIKTWKILLLEAGPPEGGLSEFPALTGLLQFTDYNWGYEAEPQAHACLAVDNGRCPWPKGKALGGSSAINLMIFTRGNPEDYNRWAALGNPGWSYSDVLPYFLKSEDARLNDSVEAYHNKGGYLSIENTLLSEFGATFISAGTELGYAVIDHNSPAQIGFSRLQVNTKQGRRHSAATAFILPVLHREHLIVLTGAKVTKILIDPSTNTALGVDYTWANNTYTAKAKKEVILSAGVFNSPQLLMLSGIGPKAHLDELGIPTLSDLPVGETIYDHVVFSGIIITTNVTNNGGGNFGPMEFLQFYTTGEGPLSSIAGFEALAFLTTDISEDEGYPDVELLFGIGSMRADNGTIGRRLMGMTDDYFNKMFTPPGITTDVHVDVVLLHPRSKGFLRLQSTRPSDFPLLYANYFTDPENRDVKTIVAAIRLISKLIETPAFRKYDAQLFTKPFVGCEHLPFDSEEHWECALRLIPRSAHHQTSTCKMGPPNDTTAVVNHELKVYGIRKLRVADASVIPIPLSAHTNAPSIMVGEKASDIIKKEWRNI